MHTLLACGLCFSTASPLFGAAVKLPTDLSQKTKPPTLKVLIAHNQDRVLLEAKGRHIVYDPVTTLEVGSSPSSKRAAVLPHSQGIQWKELFPGMHQMRIVPGDSQSTLLINGIEYRGCVEIYEVDGKLNVVNEIDVERYLRSTLASQVPRDLDEEVLDALAIVLRTQAYAAIHNRTNPYYDVDAQEVGYEGYALTLQNVDYDLAVQRTKHIVLTYEQRPFAAMWTPDSAGKTAAYSAIFRKESPAPHGIDTPIAAHKRSEHAWSFALSKQELADLLGVETVRELSLYQDATSHKVYAARITTEKQPQDIHFFRLQQKLGRDRLRSNDFTVKTHGNQVIFTGFGEGHGVGLCLFSAISMAEQGAPTQQILSTFFPDTQIQRVDSLSSLR